MLDQAVAVIHYKYKEIGNRKKGYGIIWDSNPYLLVSLNGVGAHPIGVLSPKMKFLILV